MVSAIGQVIDADEEATDQSRSMETKCVDACDVMLAPHSVTQNARRYNILKNTNSFLILVN